MINKKHDSEEFETELRGGGSAFGKGLGMGNVWSGIRRHKEAAGFGRGDGTGSGDGDLISSMLYVWGRGRGDGYGAGQSRANGMGREAFEVGGTYCAIKLI